MSNFVLPLDAHAHLLHGCGNNRGSCTCERNCRQQRRKHRLPQGRSALMTIGTSAFGDIVSGALLRRHNSWAHFFLPAECATPRAELHDAVTPTIGAAHHAPHLRDMIFARDARLPIAASDRSPGVRLDRWDLSAALPAALVVSMPAWREVPQSFTSIRDIPQRLLTPEKKARRQ